LSSEQVLVFLAQVATLLVVASLLGFLARKLRLPTVVGELFAGVLLGPSLLGAVAPGLVDWLTSPASGAGQLLEAVGQLGVLLLVGITGAQLDVIAMRRRRTKAVSISLLGLVVPLAFGVALGFLMPRSLTGEHTSRTAYAAFLGVAMCVSAIPVIAKALDDMALLHRNVGQLTLAAAAVDDTVGWLLLSAVSAMATVGLRWKELGLSMLVMTGFLVVSLLLARPLVGWALARTAGSPEPTSTVALAVAVILVGSMASAAAEMEAVFGAFIAGLVMSMSRGIQPSHLAPLRTVTISVFAPIFLATAGLRMDLTALRDPLILLAALVVLAVAISGKFLGAYAGARISSLGHWEGIAIGAGLNARGVIEVVVATVGLRIGVLNTATYTIVVLVAVVTSVMAPPIIRLAMRHVDENEEEAARKTVQDAWRLGPVAAPPQ
jgi:Kef-type K+ transport system membrane component KefB